MTSYKSLEQDVFFCSPEYNLIDSTTRTHSRSLIQCVRDGGTNWLQAKIKSANWLLLYHDLTEMQQYWFSLFEDYHTDSIYFFWPTTFMQSRNIQSSMIDCMPCSDTGTTVVCHIKSFRTKKFLHCHKFVMKLIMFFPNTYSRPPNNLHQYFTCSPFPCPMTYLTHYQHYFANVSVSNWNKSCRLQQQLLDRFCFFCFCFSFFVIKV